jgi:anti-sigma factor RsiW
MNNTYDMHLRVLEKETLQCSDISKLLIDYFDQDLAPTLQARVDAHISCCEKCQEMKAGYEQIINLARELDSEPLPSAVQNRLRQALNARLSLALSAVEE